MRKKIKLLILIVIGVVLIGIIAYLSFLLIVKKEEKKHLTIYGNVDIRQVDLGFRVFGKVAKCFYDEGDEVKTGNLLSVLDNVPYEEDLMKAKAVLKETEIAYQKAKEQFDKRFKVDKEAISKEDYDNAFYNLEEMKANVDRAKAELERAATNLNDTQMLCPTEGIILTRIREPGSVLNPGDPVFTVSIKDPVWIRAYVNEPNLGKIYFGMPANIITDTKGIKVFKGHIGFISPVAEFTPKTVESLDLRTDLVYRLRIYVEDPTHELKQGMPVTVKFDLHK
jgi:HlyD family secretion protein